MQTGGRRSNLFGIVLSLVLLINLNAVSAKDALGGSGDISAASSHSALAINTFQYTGAAVASIPILVPPGRSGIQPNLSLTYNNYRGNGWIGVGWDLDMGAIQRSTKRGVCYECDDYVASMNGSSSELVPRTDWGPDYYGAKIEGAFTKYRYNGSNGWEVTTKDGTTYFYGQSPESRQDDPQNPGRVFKWCLDRVVDINGNYMAIYYDKNLDGVYQGQTYLERIEYSGHTNGAGTANYVEFNFDSVRTDVPARYTTNFEVKTIKRLKEIEIYGNGDLARKYDLGYIYSESTGRSLLKSIRQYGSDGLSVLPEVSINWQGEISGTYNKVKTPVTTNDWNFIDSKPGDYNGDGLTDIFSYYAGYQVTFFSNGDGTYNKVKTPVTTHDWSFTDSKPGDYNGDGLTDIFSYYGGYQVTFFSNGDGTYNKVKTPVTTNDWSFTDSKPGDYNGDGLTDIFSYYGGYQVTFFSNGNGTYNKVKTPVTSNDWDYRYSMPGDYDGDGLTDIFSYYAGYQVTFFSNGNGTYNKVKTPVTTHDWSFTNSKPGDYNGDGLTDIFSYYGGYQVTFFSNGDGIYNKVKTPVTTNDWSFTDSKPGDYNGDGLTDIFSYSAGHQVTFFSNGDGTYNKVKTPVTSNDWDYRYSMPGDYNGDGLTDIFSYYGGYQVTFFSNGPFPDLLTSINNGLGFTSTVEYNDSSQLNNTLLPFIVHTVFEITVDDGISETADVTISYDYSGGLFDFATREFRGFETVTQTNPDGTILKTKFYQGDPIDPADNFFFQGRQKWVELRAPNQGPLLTKTDFTWETYPPSPSKDSWALVKLTDKLTESYDTETVTAQENYLYDDTNGNLMSMTTSGPEAESVTTSFLYENFGDWLWRKTQETVEGSISGMVRESYYDYEPGTGNLLYKEFWQDTGPNPRIAMTYDEYGNQQMVTDARGNTTITEYDSATHTYPIKITYPQTNGVSHVVENEEWDYRFGKPTVTKDENGNRTYYHYDEFGRLNQVDSPDGGQVITKYYDDVSPRYVLTKAKEDSFGATIDTYEYFDGLGRSIQTIGFGENGQPIVTKTRYDVMGRVDQTWGPFFSTFIGYHRADDIPDNIPYAKTDYDLRGRPVRMQAPLGEDVDSASSAVTTLSYSGLSTTIADPDGGKKTEIKDYLGRIIQVTEYSDAGELFTDYRYNAVGDLLDVMDAMGNVTSISYDSLGRKISMTDPDMGYWQYTYDANGNLDTQTDAKGHRIKFRYDAINRVYQKEYLDTGDPRVDYVYDLGINGIGRLYSVSNGEGTTVYDEYDPLGRQKSVTRQITGAPLAAYTTHYSYDYAGKVKSMIYPGTNPYQVNYDYHPGSGLLHTVTGISDFTEYAELTGYEATGKIGDIYHGNGAETLYTYDAKSTRLLSIQTTDPNLADLLHKSYMYTPAGDIKTITRVGNAQSITYSYAYDKLHRLIAETNSGGSDAFDPSMLIKTYDDTAPIHAVKSVKFNGVDYPYLYDENGNMTIGWDFTDPSRPVERQIDFNADNMPVQIRHMRSSGTVKIDLNYDGAGVRVRKAVQGGITTYYIGDHYEVKHYKEKNDYVATKFIFAGNLRVAGITGNDINYFHKDHLGSSLVITDKNGNVIESAEYTPFGCLRNHAGSTVSDYKFTDQEYDPSSGLYNYNARLYDPNIGSFISPDPFVQAPFDPQTLNRYTYVRNNPLIYIDPSGYGFFKKAWKKVKKAFKKAKKFVNNVGKQTVGIVAGGAVAILTGNPVLGGMVYGAVSGAMEGGIEGAIVGAAVGAITGGIWGADTIDPIAKSVIGLGFGALQGHANSAMADDGGGGSNKGKVEYTREPDFVTGTVSISLFFLPWPVVNKLVSWSFSVTVDRYGNWYYSPVGPGIGRAPKFVSVALTVNSILKPGNSGAKPSATQLKRFLSGHGVTGAAGFWAGGNVMYSFGNGFAGGTGFVTPQAGANYSYSWQGPGNLGISW